MLVNAGLGGPALLHYSQTKQLNARFASKDMTANSCKSIPIQYPASWPGLI